MPHIHELYDFTVSVFIVYKDKILLVHHPRYDKWIPMGGHIELDEDPETALFREIKEETGLDVTILSSKPEIQTTDTKFQLTPNFVDVHEANPPHRHIALVYFAQAKDNNHTLSEEHTDIKWLGAEDLDKESYNLSESVKFYCREALAKANATGDGKGPVLG
ncbi:MAG TPA: NUDIX domain-containing protein [Candidatus Saccharimonadales bacterium]|nr:NUDIX domain-containing protein [Candidatus Saccharimonadales bacterium]